MVAKRKVKNPNDKRVLQRSKESMIFYLPISRDVVDALGLDKGSIITAEIGLSQAGSISTDSYTMFSPTPE